MVRFTEGIYMSVLFVNACVRKNSMTKLLASKLLKTFNISINEIRLEEIKLLI